jgi:hypothetical protein
MGKRVVLASLIVGALFISGCALFPPAPESLITGYVVNSTSGEPVVGSRLLIQGLTTGFTTHAITNREGRFSVRVEPDRYELKLSKQGYGGSRVIGLDAHTPTTIRIVQREVFNPAWSTEPPEVSIIGVEDGDEFQGEIPYRIEATGENDILYIYVALGKTPGASFLTAPRYIFIETPSTGEQTLDPRAFGVRGPTTFEVVVYDINGNRTHLIRKITVIPPEGLVASPQEPRAIAVTLGKQVKFFSLEGSAVPANTNIYVQLDWKSGNTPDVTGYRIWRSFDGENFEPIATVHAGQKRYMDADPRLRVGEFVYYRVTALRGGEESEPSEVVRTRPLAPFDVRLLTPKDEAKDVSRIPLFRWEPTRLVGRYRIYGLVLWDTVLGEEAFWITPEPPDFVINRTSYRWNEDGRMKGTPWEMLQPHRIYEWQVAYAVAVDDLENPTAVSVAINRFGLEHEKIPIRPISIEATDNFSFTTGD